VAALEPHFAARLCEAAGVQGGDAKAMFRPETHAAITAFFASQSRAELDALAVEKDLPIHTMGS
jgi:alpha-methylacyl-CoA racemase